MSTLFQIVEAPTTTVAEAPPPVAPTTTTTPEPENDDGGLLGDVVDLVNPIDPITDVIGLIPTPGGLVDSISEGLLELFFGAIREALANALTQVLDLVFGALDHAGTVDLAGGWFDSGNNNLLAMTTGLGLTLVLAFFFASIIRGLLRGEYSLITRAALVDVPIAIMGTIAIGTFAQMALAITDAATGALLESAAGDLGAGTADILLSPAAILSMGLLQGLMMIIYIMAALATWFWLLMRSAMIYLVMVIAPLAIATRAFPPAANYSRRIIDLGIALIVSKFFLAVALAVGAQAFAAGTAEGAGGLGPMAIGTATMCLAAFMPSIVLKLIPMAEGATAVSSFGSGMSKAVMTGVGVGMMASGAIGGSGAAGGAGGAEGAAGAGGSNGGYGGLGGGSEPSNPQPSSPTSGSPSDTLKDQPDPPSGSTRSDAAAPGGAGGTGGSGSSGSSGSSGGPGPAGSRGADGVTQSPISGGGVGTISGRSAASGSFGDL